VDALRIELSERIKAEEIKAKAIAEAVGRGEAVQVVEVDEGPQNAKMVLVEYIANWPKNVLSKDPLGSTRVIAVMRAPDTGRYYVSAIGTAPVSNNAFKAQLRRLNPPPESEDTITRLEKRSGIRQRGRGADIMIAFTDKCEIIRLTGSGTHTRYKIKMGEVTQERVRQEEAEAAISPQDLIDAWATNGE
jgi:hypothetical protein